MRDLTVQITAMELYHGGCTFVMVSGYGDAIVAPDAPIREQFYKEIGLYAIPNVRCSEVLGFIKILPTIMKSGGSDLGAI